MKVRKKLMMIMVLGAAVPVVSGFVLAEDSSPKGAEKLGRFQMTEIWTALADTQGVLNQNMGTASCEAAEFSPDAQLIIAGSKGRMVNGKRLGQRVTLWNRQGELLWERERLDEVEAVAFSPNSQFAAAGGEDKLVEIYRIHDDTGGVAPQLVATLEHPHGIDGLRFSHDSRLLATGDEGSTVRLWDTGTWQEIAAAEHTGGRKGSAINQLDFTSDDQKLVSAGQNGQVRVWAVQRSEDAASEKSASLILDKILEGHEGTVKSVRISPDDKYIAAGAGGGQGVRLWDMEGNPVGHIRATGWIMETLEWSPCGGILLTGGNEGEEEDENGPWTYQKGETNGMGNVRAYRLSDILEGRVDPEAAASVPAPGPGVKDLPGQAIVPLHVEPLFRQEYLHFSQDCDRLLISHEDGSVRFFGVVLPKKGS